MSKKEQILTLTEQGDSAGTIAEKVDTTKSYVYKVRSEGNSKAADTNSSRSDSSPAVSGEEISEDSAAPSEAPDDAEAVADGGDDLTFGDDPEPKEYDCGNCETAVPYLEKHCPECGEKLMWSKIDS